MLNCEYFKSALEIFACFIKVAKKAHSQKTMILKKASLQLIDNDA